MSSSHHASLPSVLRRARGCFVRVCKRYLIPKNGQHAAGSVFAAGIVTLALLVTAADANAARLYRYLNAKGITEISRSVPNDRVKHGYEVIDSMSGRVLDIIAPELNPEEADAQVGGWNRTGSAITLIAALLMALLVREDLPLLGSQSLRSIETRISNAQANLAHVRNQQRELEDQAAMMERAGNEPTAMLMANIERAKSQILTLQGEIDSRNQDKDSSQSRFDEDRRLFAQESCLLAIAGKG